MNLLNRSDLNNKPLFKYITIALVVVNAFILAFLLFGPGRGSSAQASTPSGDPAAIEEAGSTEEDAEIEEDESEDSGEAYTSEESSDDEDEDGNDSDDEEEMPESGPILELTDDHVTLKVGDYFNFYDYIRTMKDRDGSELSRYIHLSGEVNTYQPGDYTITYQITSQIDGQTASKDLQVTVEY